ncbi:hypothetical protein LXL04_038283 [Taraxacum kok-saghyz]
MVEESLRRREGIEDNSGRNGCRYRGDVWEVVEDLGADADGVVLLKRLNYKLVCAMKRHSDSMIWVSAVFCSMLKSPAHISISYKKTAFQLKYVWSSLWQTKTSSKRGTRGCYFEDMIPVMTKGYNLYKTVICFIFVPYLQETWWFEFHAKRFIQLIRKVVSTRSHLSTNKGLYKVEFYIIGQHTHAYHMERLQMPLGILIIKTMEFGKCM